MLVDSESRQITALSIQVAAIPALDSPTHAKLLDDLSVLLRENQRAAVFVTTI